MRDLVGGTTRLVTPGANHHSVAASLSADGRTVIVSSDATPQSSRSSMRPGQDTGGVTVWNSPLLDDRNWAQEVNGVLGINPS